MPNLASTVALMVGMGAQRRVPAMLNYTAGAEGLQNACVAATINTIISSRKFIETANLHNIMATLKNVRVVYLEDMQRQFGVFDKLMKKVLCVSWTG